MTAENQGRDRRSWTSWTDSPGVPEEQPAAGSEATAASDPAAAEAGLPGESSQDETGVAGGDSTTSEQSELESLARERDEYLDSLRRLQAEFENYRKRVAKQQVEQVDRAAEGLVRKLLPVLDTVDMALAHVGGDDSGPVDDAAQVGALSQVAAALFEVLSKEGLERIDPIGMAFSPVEHDAVAHEGDDGGEGPQVVEVLRSGWRWKGRVVRPAMVKVKG